MMFEYGQTAAKNATLLASLVPGDVFTAVMPAHSVASNGVLFIEREMSCNWYNYESATLFVLSRMKAVDFIENSPGFEAMVRSMLTNITEKSELFTFCCITCKVHKNPCRARFILEPTQIVVASPEIMALEHEHIVIHS